MYRRWDGIGRGGETAVAGLLGFGSRKLHGRVLGSMEQCQAGRLAKVRGADQGSQLLGLGSLGRCRGVVGMRYRQSDAVV